MTAEKQDTAFIAALSVYGGSRECTADDWALIAEFSGDARAFSDVRGSSLCRDVCGIVVIRYVRALRLAACPAGVL